MLYFTLLVLCAYTSADGALSFTPAPKKPSHPEENATKDGPEYKEQYVRPKEKHLLSDIFQINFNQFKMILKHDETAQALLKNEIPSMSKEYGHHADNARHYKSISDEDGREVDLYETAYQKDEFINSLQIQFLLFTRKNPIEPQYLISDNSSSVLSSNYDSSKPLNVIVHGWRSSKASLLNIEVTKAFLSVYDCNVIVLDWGVWAKIFPYTVASELIKYIGAYLGSFLVFLIHGFDGNWNNVHLVGHSLGAHVVGNAGRTVGGLVARITGLDPAGPFWCKPHFDEKLRYYALRATDGQYVEAIHTDIKGLGITEPIGHVDFYLNGGQTQPGCSVPYCSHKRAYYYFAASIVCNQFWAKKCMNLQQAKANECTGEYYLMGNGDLNKQGSGIYALSTTDQYPYYQ